MDKKKPTFVSNKDESVRMFDNPVLDKMSRVHFMTPIILFVPPIIYFVVKSLVWDQAPVLPFVGFFALGVFLWTLAEYVIHRWVFHGERKTRLAKFIQYTFHGIHHDYPKDSKRLVMVPVVSLPATIGLYFFFTKLFGTAGIPLFTGFGAGYVIYDTIHFMTHHVDWNFKPYKALQRYHMRHHFKDTNEGYGVSTPFWDYIFQTQFR